MPQLSLIRVWLLLLLAYALSRTSPAAVSVNAQLDRTSIMAGETVTLNVTVEGGRPETAETFPPIAGLSVDYQGHSQNITSINGQTSFKHVLSYTVSASKPGQYTLPSISVTVDGASYKTQPVSLTVVKADAGTQNRYAFLRLNVPRTEVYVGEMFPVELQLYVIDAENPQQPQVKSDGFVIHKRVEPTQSRAQVGNNIYTVVSFKMALSAAKAGKLSLGPAEMGLTLKIRTQPDPNDLFGVFGRFQRRNVTLNSSAVEMNVLPLPTPVPPDFSGGIGRFDWTVTESPTTLAAGDPITLKIAIRGRGNLDNLKLPAFNWRGFKSYEATSSVSSEDPLGLEGVKSFEQVVVPQDATLREVPELTLTYFNPEQKSYQKLAQAAVPIKVTPGMAGGVSSLPNAAAAEEEPPAPQDIVHIKSDPGALFALAPPLVQQPSFLLLQLVPLAGVVGVTLWRKRQEHLTRNPKLRRRIQVQESTRSGLVELRNLAAAQQSEPFYALLFRLLQEQLGERLDLPASAITEAVLDERLPRRGASPELLERLHRLFQLCNQVRYAPVKTETELLSTSSYLEKALRDLQQLPD